MGDFTHQNGYAEWALQQYPGNLAIAIKLTLAAASIKRIQIPVQAIYLLRNMLLSLYSVLK